MIALYLISLGRTWLRVPEAIRTTFWAELREREVAIYLTLATTGYEL